MKKEKLRQLAHLVAGVLILNHGFDAFEKPDLVSAAAYLAISIFFLVVAGIHSVVSVRFRRADQMFFLLESLTLGFSAWQYSMQGNKPLFCLMAVAAVFYFIFAMGVKNGRKKHHSGKRRRVHSARSFHATSLTKKAAS